MVPWHASFVQPFETGNIDDFNGFLLLLKSLIEEHARLDFSDFLSTLLAIFHVINEKFQNDRSFRSPRLLGTSE